jgi:thiol-disulfide isomerase/thioredoxin
MIHMPPFNGATEWLNSPPLTPEGLRGKVVLVSFWTYTCINWLRTVPYLRAWADKYKDQGLVVVGVHTPEFSFEHNIDNVKQAVESLRITYPVVVDNNYAVWNAFSNHYWPALYFVDTDGLIRHDQFGEGEYETSERVIQELLAEAGVRDVSESFVSVEPQGAEAPADWVSLGSPETYLGYQRSIFSNYPSNLNAGRHNYPQEPDQSLHLNQWTLVGDWTVGEESVGLNAANGKILIRFHARDLNLVMGPANRGTSIKFKVRLNGEPPKRAHGTDTSPDGFGQVTGQRLYQLIRQPQPIAERQFEIEFPDPGVQALAFTFG